MRQAPGKRAPNRPEDPNFPKTGPTATPRTQLPGKRAPDRPEGPDLLDNGAPGAMWARVRCYRVAPSTAQLPERHRHTVVTKRIRMNRPRPAQTPPRPRSSQ
jgi:hypothetical protein